MTCHLTFDSVLSTLGVSAVLLTMTLIWVSLGWCTVIFVLLSVGFFLRHVLHRVVPTRNQISEYMFSDICYRKAHVFKCEICDIIFCTGSDDACLKFVKILMVSYLLPRILPELMIFLQENKKRRESGQKCHGRTMTHSKLSTNRLFTMNRST